MDHLSGLEDVELVQVGAHVILHVLDHATEVGNVRLGVRHRGRETGLCG